MAKALTSQQKKDWAQTLYLQNQLTQNEIAAKVGMHHVTLSKLIKKENWEKLRKSLLTTKSEMLAFLYDQLSKIKDKHSDADDAGDSKTADMVVKYTAAIKNLETETSVAELMEAGHRFHKYLQVIDPKRAMDFLNDYDGFIKDQLKRF